MNIDEVMDEIRKDKRFYYNSGGGITISGGEAFLQPHFLLAILSAARKELIHSAIETCGYFRWGKTTCRILENADLVLYDLKLIDSEKHMKWTGKGNHLILENVKKVAKKVETVIRFPIISGINDSREDVDNMCRFISNIGAIREIHLIPYHALGEFKYSMLQRAYPKENFLTPGAERIQRIKGCFEAREIRTIIEN